VNRRGIRRLIIGLLAIPCAVLGLFGFLIWEIRYPHTPDLSPARAAAIIAASPEFTRRAKLVTVVSTHRGEDSLKDVYYSADFTLAENGSTTPTHAQADFGYGKAAWHLTNFSYGAPPDVDLVWVHQRAPGRSK
jgi:hypothetical protein